MRKFTILLGIVVIAGAAWFLSANNAPYDDSVDPNTIVVPDDNNAVYVPNQPPGNTLTAGFAIVNANAFLVVRDNQGKIGDPIGASALLIPGTHNNITVEVSKPMVDRTPLFAMLYKDDGDGLFDVTKDQPMKDIAGSNLYTIFQVYEGEVPVPVEAAP